MTKQVIPHLHEIITNPTVTPEQRGWIIGLVGALDHYADMNWLAESDEQGTKARQALYGEDA